MSWLILFGWKMRHRMDTESDERVWKQTLVLLDVRHRILHLILRKDAQIDIRHTQVGRHADLAHGDQHSVQRARVL